MSHSAVFSPFVRNLVENGFELLLDGFGAIGDGILPVADAQSSKRLPICVLVHTVDIGKILHPCNTDSLGRIVLKRFEQYLMDIFIQPRPNAALNQLRAHSDLLEELFDVASFVRSAPVDHFVKDHAE